MTIARTGRLAAVLFRLFVVLLALSSAGAHAALTYSWTGTGGNNLWSNANNWNPVGTPTTGDSVAFPAGAANVTNQNDLPAGTVLNAIFVNGSGYTLLGNRLVITSGIASLGSANRLIMPIDVQANAIYIEGPGQIEVSGSISGTGPITVRNGTIKFLGSHTYSGTMSIGCTPNCAYVQMNGALFPSATISNSYYVVGNGTFGTLNSNGTVSPGQNDANCCTGNGLGVIRVTNLALAGGTYNLDFDTGGSDWIIASGSVSLANVTLNVAMTSIFRPYVGHVIEMIRKDSAGPVSGTFASKPEGTIIRLNGADYRLTYAGGDGNDVQLVCIAAPKSWIGSTSSNWSNPANWSDNVVPQAGDSLLFTGPNNFTTNNDLPAGLSLRAITVTGFNFTLNGNRIAVTESITSPASTTTFNLPIDVTGSTLVIEGSGTLQFAGSLGGSGAINLRNGSFRISGTHTFTGTLNVQCVVGCAYTQLNGASMPNVDVVNQYYVVGNGTLRSITSQFATTSPGSNNANCCTQNGTGFIVTGPALINGGTMNIDINGTTAGTGYDQLDVTGTVTLQNNPTLNIGMSASFAPQQGQVFTLIKNDGADAVTGTFSGKPGGSILTLNGAEFRLDYNGGDGNDVTLTCTFAPRTWTGGGSNGFWSNPANWSGNVVPSAGDSLQFPQGGGNLSNTNDLPPGTAFRAISVSGNGYTLNGNRLVLTSQFTSNGNGTTVNLPMDVQANAVLFDGNGLMTLAGELSGTGPITMRNGTTRIEGTHSYSGTITAQCTNGCAYVQFNGGAMPNANLQSTYYVVGNGRVGTLRSAVLSPGPNNANCCTGNQTGTFATGNFSFSGGATFNVDINGPSAGTGYDQVLVSGPVALGTSTTLNLAMSPSFVPSKGQVYTIIRNDAGTTTGAFSGRPEGQIITLNGYQLKLSYVGGASGRDVTLTSLNGKETTTMTLASSLNPSNPGQSVTFTTTVSGAFGTPTGTITFRDGLTTLGTRTLSSGSASITVTSLVAGSHAISAEYSGDGTYGGNGSDVLTQVVNAFATSTTLASSLNPSLVGQAVTFTATVSSTGGTPTGSVNFRDGTTDLGTVALSGGQAQLSLSTLSLGTHSITATYAASGNFAGSASSAVSQVVNPAISVPGAPVIGTASAGDGQAWVSFSPPASDGGAAITSYIVYASTGQSMSTSGSPVNFTGLPNGTPVTFTVRAVNSQGVGAPSAPSNSVTPTAGAGNGVTNGLANVLQVVATYESTCVLTTSGGVKCWGGNTFGQLGDGTNASRTSPVDVVGLQSGVVAIGGSAASMCAITTGGALKCWGYNETGGLGVGDNVSRNVPTQVVGLTSGVAVVSPGNGHACAIMEGGAVKCWGHGQNGRLGIGPTGDRYSPVDVALPGPATSLGAGANHTCAVIGNAGRLMCWGGNETGQLGIIGPDRDVPTDVTGMSTGVVGVTTGTGHTCARMADDRLLCWGANAYGEVGDGSTTQRDTPVNIAGVFAPDVDAAANWYTTCILSDAGGVQCWGRNDAGQVGDSSTTNRTTPVDVLGLTESVAEVSAGFKHTCVVTATAKALCWGDNAQGQLGNGGNDPQPLPGPVQGKQPQTITFNAPASPARFQSSFTLDATASSGLAVSFSVTGPCSVSGNTVTMTGSSGTCAITASQAGDGSWLAATSVTRSVDAAKAANVISFPQPLSPATFNTTFPALASASSGLPVSIAASGACSIAGTIVTMTAGTGSCSLTASQAGNGDYEAAASVTRTVDAAKASQSITFDAPATPAAFQSTFGVTATSSAGLSVSIAASGVCSISGGTVTMTSGTGTCTLTATQAGNDNYAAAAAVTRTVLASKKAQSITFDPPASPAAYQSTFTISPTATSGLVVDVVATGVCSISGGTVTMTAGTGTCTLVASQAGNDDYAAATAVTRTVEASKIGQSITFAPPASPATYQSSFGVSATSTSGLAVSIAASGVCSLSGGTVTMTAGTGTCTLTATQAGNDNYSAAAAVVRTVEASKAAQSITFVQPTSPAAFQSSFPVSPSASSGLAVSVTVSGVCSLAGNTVTMTSGTGTCAITASQAGNGDWAAAASVTRNVEASRIAQSITMSATPATAGYLTSFPVSASSSSGLGVAISAAGVCSLSGGTVTMTSGTGNCVITASQAGDGNYLPAADVVRTVVAARIAQAITFGALGDRTYGDGSFAVSASASSGLAVGFESLTANCSVSGNTVTVLAAGGCTIRAVQGGDGNWLAATPVEQSFTVNRRVVSVAADHLAKFVGNADPALTFSITGGSLVAGDAFTGALARAAGEAAGDYAIGQGTLALSANYDLRFTGSVFTIVALAVAGPADPVQFGTAATITATWPDAGSPSTPTCSAAWGDPALASSTAGTVAKVGGNWVCTVSRVYSAAGVYAPVVTVVDGLAGSTSGTFQYVVVYDPAGGFVTGGGWITSPAGAYAADPSVTGRANFGFVSKYQNGSTVPTGNTQFQFKAANFSFNSTAYEWMVISGSKVRYRGVGTVNGAGSFGFELTAIDGDLNGTRGPDLFRLQVWDANRGNAMVYDNMMGATAGADPTTALGGGSIQIHR